ANTTVEVAIDARDDVAVREVELFADGRSVAVLPRAPYLFQVPAGAGGRTLSLRAVARDSIGQEGSATVALPVTADTSAPLVGFRSPSSGARVFAGRPLQVEAVASDDVAVAGAELFADGVSQGSLAAGLVDGLFRVFRWTVPVAAARAGTSLELRVVAR